MLPAENTSLRTANRVDPAMNRAAVIFAMTYPTLLTWIYFTALKDSPGAWQQAAFGIGKFVQFAFPAFWVFVVQRQRFGVERPTTRGLGLAILLGAFELAAGLALYFIWLKPGGVFADPVKEMLAKLQGFGLDSRAGLIGLGVIYSLAHSWLEEYYWRWFVLKKLLPESHSQTLWPRALVISSLAFAAHHVVVLAGYFGWTSPWTYILSAVVATGGGLFGWLYLHSKSLYPAWLAHAFADAVIFIIGYDLLAGMLS